jgi:radical SAM protein with 4Fe4S-binding SPASM domain
MPALRYSQEPFGYLVVLPDGSVELYDDGAGVPLATATTADQLEPYRLTKLSVPPEFHLSSPLIVWFEVTRKCNLKCSHCYINAGKARPNELSFTEVEDVLRDLRATGVFSLVLAGGEPYLRRDFAEIVELAGDLGFIISIVTNGTYLTPKVLRRLPTRDCRITLSVDGIAAHNAIRGGASTFELMASRLDLMQKMDIPCSVSTVISKANIHELGDLLEWCMKRDIVFRTVTFNPLGRGLLNRGQHALRPEDAAASADLFMTQKRFEAEKDKEIGPCVSKFFNYALNLMYMTRREHCARSIAYIAANGDVYPCVSSAAIEGFGAGNVRDRPFSELWEHSFSDMRAITWEHFDVCHTCPYSSREYFCANRCPCMSLVLNGELFGCGATDFEKEDLRLRTQRLRSELGYVY